MPSGQARKSMITGDARRRFREPVEQIVGVGQLVGNRRAQAVEIDHQIDRAFAFDPIDQLSRGQFHGAALATLHAGGGGLDHHLGAGWQRLGTNRRGWALRDRNPQVFDRIATDRHVHAEQEVGFASHDQVTILQRGRDSSLAVDVGAVGTLQIGQSASFVVDLEEKC